MIHLTEIHRYPAITSVQYIGIKTPSNQGNMRNNKRTLPNVDKGEVLGNWKSGPIKLHAKEPQSRCTKEYICVY